LHFSFIDSIHKIQASEWDALCPPDYPFIRHAFLAALEDSQSTHINNGWEISHLICIDNQQLVAAMPGYIKTHSYGEYVFDWSWADAYKRYGQNYYPKWINAIPFTPCTGPRSIINEKYLLPELISNIIHKLNQECSEKNYSGWHCLFPNEEQHQAFHQQGIDSRLGCQFHWFNKNYQLFDDFLQNLQSRKRKNIRKERQQVSDQGFKFNIKENTQITEEDLKIFYTLYRNTYLKRSGHPGYLSLDFFLMIGQRIPESLLLIQAIDNQQKIIAASLFFRDQHTLYGRYWGCFEEYQFLHFETCYYQGIDYAIANKLQRFDGGAQGEHKIARGFEPVLTYSQHWIQASEFRTAISHFLIEEAEAIKAYAADARTLLPFKQTNQT
jgi:uncharacterized protein